MKPKYGRTEKVYGGGSLKSPEWRAIRVDVHLHFGFNCWGCQMTLKAKGNRWYIHHMDRDAHNNNRNNLVLLCGRCHGQAHSQSEEARKATTLKRLLSLLTDNHERKTRVMKRRYKRLYGKDKER